jgi:hypothetical protein
MESLSECRGTPFSTEGGSPTIVTEDTSTPFQEPEERDPFSSGPTRPESVDYAIDPPKDPIALPPRLYIEPVIVDHLVVEDRTVVLDHHGLNGWRNNRRLRIRTRKPLNCLYRSPTRYHKEVSALSDFSCQDGRADESAHV